MFVPLQAERIVKKLGVPVQLVASTAQDGFFRKPRPGIWFWIQEHHQSNR